MTIDAPTKRGPRGPYAKSSTTRRVILDAALEVFAQSGYRSGSLRDVAARVEMSEAGLLHHFPNKSALLAAVLERRDDHSRDLFRFDTSAGRQTLLDLVALARYNATIPGVVELFCTLSAEATSPDHPAHAYFQERYRSTIAMLVETFTQLAASGQLEDGVEVGSAARQAIALWDGLQIQWLLDRGSLDMADQLIRFFDRFLREPLEQTAPVE